MLLCRDDPIVPVLQRAGEPVFVMDVNPTAENIARLIYERTASRASRSSRWSSGKPRTALRPMHQPVDQRTPPPNAIENHHPASRRRVGGCTSVRVAVAIVDRLWGRHIRRRLVGVS